MTSTNPFDPTGHCFSQTFPALQRKTGQDHRQERKRKKNGKGIAPYSPSFSAKNFLVSNATRMKKLQPQKDNSFPLYQQQYKTMSIELKKCSASLSTYCSENTSLLAFQIRKYSESKLHT